MPNKKVSGGAFNAWRILLRSLALLWRTAPAKVTLLTALLVIQGVVPALNVYLTKATIDGLTALLQGGSASLVPLVALWAGSIAISQLLAPFVQMLQGDVAELFTTKVNLDLMRKSEELKGLDALERPGFHDDLLLLRDGARNRALNVLVLSVYAARSLVAMVSLAAVLATLAWWVPFVIVLASIPYGRSILKLREVGWHALLGRSPEARRMEYDSRIALDVEHAAEVRLQGLLPWLRQRYVATFASAHRAMHVARRRQALGGLPSIAFSVVVTAGLFAWAVLQASRGALSFGGIVVVAQGMGQLQNEAFALNEGVGELFQRALFFEKYFEFMAIEPEVRQPDDPLPVPEGPLTVAFEDVSFAYPDGRVALEHVSFAIRPGETLAIVGENGAGKSTLVKLLLRFYDPTGGRVTVNGVDLRSLDVDAWRARVGAVLQAFGRYDYTLRENVTLGAAPREDEPEAVTRALTDAGLGGLVESLGGGIDHGLGKEFGGTELSGGQWQKVAIARALYRDAPLLILDEPTAALDPRSEHELFERFARLSRGRSVILITHRLASVQMADRAVVLRGGRLVEEGGHAELLRRGGEYAELWWLQAEKYGATA